MCVMASGERDPGGSSWPLGPVVGEALTRAGLSDREAGKRAGIAAATVKAMVTGHRPTGEPTRPQSAAVIKLARVLRLDVNQALELAGYDPRIENPDFQPSARTGRPPKSQRAVGNLLDRLTPRQYDAVVEVIESMLRPDGDEELDDTATVHHITNVERPRSTTPGPVVEHISHDEPARD